MQPASEALARELHDRAADDVTALEAYLALQFIQTVRPDDFGSSLAGFVDAATPQVLRQRAALAQRARPYLTAIRRIEIPGDRTWTAPTLDVLDEKARDAARASLRAVGASLFTSVRSKAAKADPELETAGLELLTEISEETWAEARDLYADQVAGAGVRHALNGARAVTVEAVRSDKLASGWARVTSDDCCFFCALLATRGFVYEKDSFQQANARFAGDGSQKVHDNCRCQLVPTYGPAAEKRFTEKQEKDWELYLSLPGKDRALLEFRRAYEGRATVEAA